MQTQTNQRSPGFRSLHGGILLCLILLGMGCHQCAGIADLPLTPPTSMITHENLIIEAGSMPPAAEISVQDRFPLPNGDGRNELWIPWSEAGPPPSLFARISVDTSLLPNGVSSFSVQCAHYSSCSLLAFDLQGNTVGEKVSHSANINTAQTLKLFGSKLGGFEIHGSEIAILEICYEE